MATKSAASQVAAILAKTIIENQTQKGVVTRIPFTYEKVAGNTDGDWIALVAVRKDWIISEILIQNDALSGCSDCDLGLYKLKRTYTAASDLEVVVVNAYYDALTLASALGLTRYGFQAAAGRDKANTQKKVWQDAGAATQDAAEDWYVIALTLVTGGTAAGTISGYVDVILPS